jgi:polyisoprenoid-binding protein YceI
LRRVVVILLVAGVLVVGGLAAYFWFWGGSGEPSIELTTTSAPAESFVIVKEESAATFEISEVLRGSPNRVIGTTNEVAGSVTFEPSEPAAASLGEITINARTFRTDNEFRDRAIRTPTILNSGDDRFELITFAPTAIDGLPEAIEVGAETTFSITGDLTIKGSTQPVTFQVTATLSSDDRIEGRAEAEVLRSDFEIGIPNAPGVANVLEEVLIRLDFVAVRESLGG